MSKNSSRFGLLAGLISLATVFSSNTQAQVDTSTMSGKFLMGYQGWRACIGDGSALNSYTHWSYNGQQPTQGNVIPDMWPDNTELTAGEQFPTGFTMGNGQPAKAYSSYLSATVARHFNWMQANGLDGVMLQRFIWDVKGSGNAAMTAHHNQVAVNVKSGAETYGRVFALMYDMSGEPSAQLIADMQNDWAYVSGTLQLTNSSRYLKHKGKPVVAIWGIGFSGFTYTTTQITTLINWFKANNCTVMGGVPYSWRTLDGDSQTNSAWTAVYHSLDVLNPWSVNRYQNENQVDANIGRLQDDLADCTANGVDYMPVAFPGYSAHNLNGGALNEVPRQGGNFYWRQIYNSLRSGCNMVYGAMFDEIDEGTALYKLAPTMQTTPTPGASSFMALDADGYTLPSDWYLRCTGQGTKSIHGDIPLNTRLPITPTNSITVTYPNGGQVLQAGDPLTVTWTSSGTVGNVNIDFSSDGGKSFRSLVYNTANTGSKAITVPYYGNTICYIRVSKTTTGTPVDWSDNDFTVQIPAPNPQSHLTKIWTLAPGDRPYLSNSGTTERGIGYDTLSDRVFVVHREGTTPFVYVLNGTTGADVATLNTTGITGGAFLLDRIGVSDDGVIYAGNVSAPAAGSAPVFKLYRWANISATPTVAYTGAAGFGNGTRVGDTFTIRGGAVNTEILVGGRGTNAISILTTANGTNFTAKLLTSTLNKLDYGCGLAFGLTNTYWVKTNARSLFRLSYNFSTGASTTLNTFSALPPTFSPFAIDATNNLLADIDVVDGHDQLNLYDISNLGATPVLLQSLTFPQDNDNDLGLGSVCFGNNDRCYALDANNGIIAFNVFREVAIKTQPQSQTVNQGANVTFTVTATGSTLSYQWKKNGTAISGATTSALTLNNVQASDAATYTVDVSNSFSSATGANATLTVIVPPTITTQPASRSNNYGTTATFTVVASGTSPTYQWQKNTVNLANGGNVSGATTATLSLTGVTHADEATYRVIVSNAAGSVTSANATLTVNEPIINTQPQNQSAPIGGSATFSVTAVGTAPLSYQWRFNAVNISGATASTYTRSNVQDSNAGSYSVVVTSPYGTVTSANAVLAVNHPPTVTLGTARNTEPVVNFESFTNNTPNGAVLFQRPAYSPTTGGYIDTVPTNYTTVTTSFPSGNSRAAAKVLKAGWTFKTGTTNAWVRLTTFNTTYVPNLTVPMDRIVRFDLHSDKSLKVGLGVRETGTTADYGANGGTTGPIEFVGVTNVVSNSPFPTRVVPANSWSTLEFNFPTEPVRAFTGDGVLATGKGVLESVALVPNGGLGAYTIHVDNLEIVTTTTLPGTITTADGSTVSFTATATDPDAGQTLTFSLDAGAPAGAGINSSSGAFTWTPTSAQVNTTNNITVRAKDNGAGLLSDAKTFTVIVTSDPLAAQSAPSTATVSSGETVTLTWDSIVGVTYRVEYKNNLKSDWSALSEITATSDTTSVNVSNGHKNRYYRIVVVENTTSPATE